ncbi:alpha/beta fold hydrolase [Boudabousia marimammalium]|uniref:AB hydrolase-1 domain-containing protein n=1 Tax=Boudabousia marimammalium TaxID=156892 RepID=A0A1Q5PRI1_9ACTO|nr:alpha/beta hydrolase [Boudabousia marimammalium]OKL50156.1 hypothetical protein BM477_01810 [Boudabousia marimammalium]
MNLKYQIWNHDTAAKTAVLAVPAFPLTGDEWEEVAKLLKMPFVAFNHPGIGSGVPGFPATPDNYADDAIATAKELGFEAVIMAGNSMGGYVSQAGAIRHSEYVRGLVLAGTKAGADAESVRLGRMQLIEEIWKSGSLAKVFSALDALVAPEFAESNPETMSLLHEWAANTSPVGVRWCQNLIANRLDRHNELATLRLSAAVIYGVHDSAATLQDAQQMAQALRTELITTQRSGHLIPVEEPDLVADAIQKVYQTAF